MFTGIIEAQGKLQQVQRHAKGAKLVIHSDGLDFSDVKLGDSIATNGVCLTVTALGNNSYSADVSSETLSRTTLGDLAIGAALNLEKAMLATSRFGGHIVSGHVDAVAKFSAVEKHSDSWQLWLKIPSELQRYVVEKGSITVDGISLTVNQVKGDALRLTIVPHTLQHTTLAKVKVGHAVNIEIDLIARYIERLMLPAPVNTGASGVDKSVLAKAGFFR